MTPTEEQRAALKRVVAYMDRMYAIASPYHGCTEDANILRAMIDSSEHFTDASKMIGFDLEKARAVDIDLLAATDWGELRRHYCAALAEIERLRAIIDTPSEEPEWVVDFKKLNRFAGVGYSLIDIEIAKKWHTAYRKAQNSNLLRKQEIERLRGEMENYGDDYVCQMKSKDARIQELEDAMVEERGNKMIQTDDCTQNQEAADIHHRCICEYNVKKCPVGQWWLDRARVALQAEGKIGPEDAKPQVWQITDEQKAALGVILARIEYDQSLPGRFNYTVSRAKDTLRAMLEEAQP